MTFVDERRQRRLLPASPQSVLELLGDLLRRPWVSVDARHYLDDYQRTQFLAPERLAERQRALLRRITWHCFLNVPHHRRVLGRALKPHQIERLEGPEILPIASADERRARPQDFAAEKQERIAERRMTAGTRGIPAPVIVDAEAYARQRAIRLRAEQWAGTPPSQVVAAWGRESWTEPRALDEAELRALELALKRARWAVLSAPGPSLARLQAIGRRAQLVSLIVRGRDDGAAASTIAATHGARIHRFYAAAEVGLIAASCEEGGLHVHADHLILESVGDDGGTLLPGETGRLVVTDLHNRAAPYLRHELGDRGRLTGERCACGRTLPLLSLDADRPRR